jgi:hypothetical protein
MKSELVQYADFIPSYIEVLTGLLVFGVTLPSLFINIPPRLKAIRDKHANINLDFLRIEKRLKFSLILQPRIAVSFIVLSILFFGGFLVPSPVWLLNLGFGQLIFSIHRHAKAIIYIILGLNVIVTALFMWALSSYTKERLLRDLDRKCRKHAAKNFGRIPSDFVNSLSELGAFCDAGQDKGSVLLILDGLVMITELHIDSRVEIVQAVQNTIVDGNEQNYIFAMEILQGSFRIAAEETSDEDGYGKLRLAEILRTLENVIIQAFVLRNPRVTAAIMTGYDEISMQEPNDYARAFLRIGRAALELKEQHHAGHGLDKLHTRITELIGPNGQYPYQHQEAVHTYFGLLAYFWQQGNTARQHALKYLDELQQVYKWKSRFIDQQIIGARYAFEGIDLLTADYLEQMLFEHRQLQYARTFLLEIEGIGKERSSRILVHYPSIELLCKAEEEGIMACGIPRPLAGQVLAASNRHVT